MYKYHDIKVVHLEITDKCNASCLQCLRNINGGKVNPHLSLTELFLEDIKSMFNKKFIKQLDRMYMCGNYGDPIMARDYLEVFKYFRYSNPKIILGMNTNGSLRPPEWWRELARIISSKGYIRFGIDGLRDTHPIYRQGTSWDKIIENAQAFISSGGKAIWDFIVFQHNEHQVKEAKKLSEQLGFDEFVVKKTWRFYSSLKDKGRESHEGINYKGEKVVVRKPGNPEYLNEALKKEDGLRKKYGSMEEYLNNVKINCKAVNEKSIYISAEGLVFPCCWLALQLYIWYLPKHGAQIWELIDKAGGVDQLNVKKGSINEIVEDIFFQKLLPKSWRKKSLGEGKLGICARICGSEFDPFAAQYN